ncbi:MAG: hypothetical protein HOC71_18190 [Candidatus Latescibacteria bacterium]|jgi:uncharacterized phosphosugar-binding protein|nr:hypothetical protein [Candidatus Latescibacterota bacterium]
MLALHFIDIAEKNLGTVLNQFDTIKKSAEMITNVVLGGNNVFVVDKYGIIDAELVERASGLAIFRSLKHGRSQLTGEDVLVISSYHSADEYDLDHLRKAHSLGASVISISPPGELAQNSDIALLNTADEQNGVITVSGIVRPFCPVNGIINAAFAWALSAEIATLIIADGKIPTIFAGEYLADGEEKISRARKEFSSRGY